MCVFVLIIWDLDLTFVARTNNGENVNNLIAFAILYKLTFQLGLRMIPNVVIDKIFSPELGFIDLFMSEKTGKTNCLMQEILKEDIIYILGLNMPMKDKSSKIHIFD